MGGLLEIHNTQNTSTNTNTKTNTHIHKHKRRAERSWEKLCQETRDSTEIGIFKTADANNNERQNGKDIM